MITGNKSAKMIEKYLDIVTNGGYSQAKKLNGTNGTHVTAEAKVYNYNAATRKFILPEMGHGGSIMKKFVVPALSLALCLGLVTGCSSKTDAPAASETAASAAPSADTSADSSAEASSEAESTTEPKSIDSLKIAFSPYADADTITTATEPLENLLNASDRRL